MTSKVKVKKTKRSTIVKLHGEGMSVKDIAKQVKVKPNYVYHSLWMDRKNKSKAAKASKPYRSLTEALIETKNDIDTVLNKDRFKSPAHYTVGGIETWDFIEAKGLNYNLGSVVKYISRADYKEDDVGDLKKAREFLDREINRRQGAVNAW